MWAFESSTWRCWLIVCLGYCCVVPWENRAVVRAESQAEEWSKQVEAVLEGRAVAIWLQSPLIKSQAARFPQLKENLLDLLLDDGLDEAVSISDLLCLSNLEHLRIRESVLIDSDLKQLVGAKWKQLRILNLPRTRITAKGIRHLRGLPKLTQLRLGGETLDDAAVLEIARLPSLKSLHLIGPKLTAKALSRLAEAPKLTSFYLDDCPLPDPAWVALFEAKPNLHVHIDQQHHDRDPRGEDH